MAKKNETVEKTNEPFEAYTAPDFTPSIFDTDVVKTTTLGQDAKNIATYVGTSAVLGQAILILVGAHDHYTAEQIGVLTSALTGVLNLGLYLGKRYLDGL